VTMPLHAGTLPACRHPMPCQIKNPVSSLNVALGSCLVLNRANVWIEGAQLLMCSTLEGEEGGATALVLRVHWPPSKLGQKVRQTSSQVQLVDVAQGSHICGRRTAVLCLSLSGAVGSPQLLTQRDPLAGDAGRTTGRHLLYTPCGCMARAAQGGFYAQAHGERKRCTGSGIQTTIATGVQMHLKVVSALGLEPGMRCMTAVQRDDVLVPLQQPTHLHHSNGSNGSKCWSFRAHKHACSGRHNIIQAVVVQQPSYSSCHIMARQVQ
jgi:hypothetical protein